MISTKYLQAIFGLALAFGAVSCTRDPTTGPECYTPADCPEAKPLCHNNFCVECLDGGDCDCHDVCDNLYCRALGADFAGAGYANNAHGNWSGEPGAPGYSRQGFCALETEGDDCALGYRCNPLTAGCVKTAVFATDCTPSGSRQCPAGQECAPGINVCMPAALCQSAVNCCGAEGFICDAAEGKTGLCVPERGECTPPETIEATCPFRPQTRGGDCNGEPCCSPERFCAHFGACVECVCDLDCNPFGTDYGLKCYLPDHTCRVSDYCIDTSECADDESCDVENTTCKPYCDEDNDHLICRGDEFCLETYHVCRPNSDKPCAADAWEPNDSLAEAVARDITLATPAMNAARVVDGLSLCAGDVDWFTIDLSAGDHLKLTGIPIGDLSGTIDAFAPDGVTRLGARGRFGDDVAFAELTANTNATHFIKVSIIDEEGFYSLTLERTPGVACTDAFEAANGSDNVPSASHVLYDHDVPGVPAGCHLTAAAGADLVECDDVMKICPGDVDYFLVKVPNGGDLDVWIDGFPGDLDLALYGPFPQAIGVTTTKVADRSDGMHAVERVATTARPAGYYLVGVQPAPGMLASASYDIAVLVKEAVNPCPEDAYDDPDTAGVGDPSPATLVVDPAGYNDASTGATQVALSPGATITVGTTALSLCRGDTDWFELGRDSSGLFVPLGEGDRVEVSLVVDEASPPGTVTLAGGTSAQDLDLGSEDPNDPASDLVFGRTSGSDRYFVEVVGTTANAGHVSYRLFFTLVEPPACDEDVLGDISPNYNDAPATATLLAPADGWPMAAPDVYEFVAGSTEVLSLCPGGDDWYRIQAPAGTQVAAWIRHDPSIADVGLVLYDDRAAAFTDPTDGAAGVRPQLGLLDLCEKDASGYQYVRGTFNGDVYLGVYNRTGWPLLDYQLGVRFLHTACFEDAYEQPENNNTWDRATLVPLVQTPRNRQKEVGILEPLAVCTDQNEEKDFYSIWLHAGDEMEASVFYEPNAGDLQLELYAPGSPATTSPLDSDEDDGETDRDGIMTVRHNVAADEPGGAYLVLVDPESTTGNYYYLEATVIRACVDDDWEPAPPQEVTVFPAWSPSVLLLDQALCFDDDWFQIDLPDGVGDVTTCIRFDNATLDLDLEVFTDIDETDPAAPVGADLLPGGRSAGKENAERVVVTRAVTTAASYWARIYPYPAPGTTTYDFWLLEGDVACPPIVCDQDGDCSNGGTCDLAANDELGECDCAVGFTGLVCDICEPGLYGAACDGDCSACGANADCDAGIVGLGCFCLDGYVGSDCEECPGGFATPCSDHGGCADNAGTPSCVCDPNWGLPDCAGCDTGWYGPACDGDCAACGINTSCDEGVVGVGCVCLDGYVGDPCLECPGGAATPCNNNGTCYDDAGTPTCSCTSGSQPECL